jgi:hypothetical protein
MSWRKNEASNKKSIKQPANKQKGRKKKLHFEEKRLLQKRRVSESFSESHSWRTGFSISDVEAELNLKDLLTVCDFCKCVV